MKARIAVILIVVFGAIALWFVFIQTRDTVALPVFGTVPQFSLTTESNLSFSRDELVGNVTIADFIFTNCAGPCPLMTAKMKELQNSLPGARFVSFSVDPEQDTPDVLKEYAGRFDADTRSWKFLTGNKQVIYSLSVKGFHLGVEDEPDAILHSTKFVLIDRAASIRGYYDSEEDSSMQRLRNETTILLSSND